MIVCSCNVLSEKQILSTLQTETAGRPRSPGQVHRCLGCKPNCGRCLLGIRRLLEDARVDGACDVGCETCPVAEAAPAFAQSAATRPYRVSVPTPYRRTESQPLAEVAEGHLLAAE
jgi:bacterioferritin-associated ferredoxin